MATALSLTGLPVEWQHWITDNLARGCTPASMEAVMVREGRFPEYAARSLIEEARELQAPSPRSAIPEIDTSSNTIALPDRHVQVLSCVAAPRVVVLGDLLSGDECDALVAYCAHRLERSMVVNDADGGNVLNEQRTSRGAMLERAETRLVSQIEQRLAALTHWPVDHGEGLQVLRYDAGNEYRPHYDWFNPDSAGSRRLLDRGGQRTATVIMYLSDVEQGGATVFPRIGLQVRPRKGSAVFFANVERAGTPDPQTLHGGEPVIRGTKFIATKWLREREF